MHDRMCFANSSQRFLQQALCSEQNSENIETNTPPSTSESLIEEQQSVRKALQAAQQANTSTRKRQADSTDFMATQLARRFGIAGGLAWVGFLTLGVLGEQIKTRIEVAQEEAGTRDIAAAEQKQITTPEGVVMTDLKVGGGSMPQKGYLMVVNYKAKANGELFEDTFARAKPIVFLYRARPLSGGMCPGVEIALQTMRAGGRRRVLIPAKLGFGDDGLTLRPTEHVPSKQGLVPPGADLEYELELVRVSIPPS